MKLACVLFIVFVLVLTNPVKASRDILKSKYPIEKVQQHLVNIGKWLPGSAYDVNWDAIPPGMKEAYLQLAEENFRKEVPAISATLTLEYSINGNRTNFSKIWNERRIRLVNAVVAEKVENKGRCIPDITDLIWAMCEETWWGQPAHYYQYGQFGLPDSKARYVDLFAGETGVLMAWTYYYLKDELDSVSPVLTNRMLDELDRRILEPCLNDTVYHWMGYQGQDLNNWTPWICSNWLVCALVCERNEQKKLQALDKIMLLLDRFMNPYNADGGCDEGPSYWGHAGATLFDCLELLELATNGYVNVWDNQLIKNIGSYIHKIHIHDNYFVNFADAAAIVEPAPCVVYRLGHKIGDKRMMQFAGWLAKQQKLGDGSVDERMGRLLPTLGTVNKLKSDQSEFEVETCYWFPNLEVATFRESADASGFYVACKGGHNKESHNHNDVGNFIVYYNGRPLLIDVGVETYTQKTFSKQRYDIWTMQSQYHNLPTINGVMQSPGRDFKARETSFSSLANGYQFSLDIAGAYPQEAGVNIWKRSVVLDSDKEEITINEHFRFLKPDNSVSFSFMTDIEPTIDQSGKWINLYIDDTKKECVKLFFLKGLVPKIEECDSSDERLRKVWGKSLYRISISTTGLNKEGELVFTLAR